LWAADSAKGSGVQRVVHLIVILLLIALVGSAVFAVAERISFGDGLYFALTTLTTVGYGDVVPRTAVGHVVAVALMLGGVGAAVYVFTSITSFVVEGKLRHVLGIRRMKKTIDLMRDHYIICGYGRLGSLVTRDLESARVDFVVVESDSAKVQEARERGHAVVEGDATVQETLCEAGLERAAGLATTISDDAENVYIGITARALYPDLPVVCRSSTARVKELFRRAGITRTISTDEMGARRIANSLLRPHVVGFMDEITQHVEGKASLHAVRLAADTALVGETIMGSQLRGKHGIAVLAIRRDGVYLPNPGPQETLRASDVLILIGTPEQVSRLRAFAEDASDEAAEWDNGAS
jgi:voltage-gated potassium channel